MKHRIHPFTYTILTFTLFSGALAAFFALGGVLLTDRGIHVDGGTEAEAEPHKPQITIVIDAGHGGEDGGAQSADGLYEKDVNLEIARLLDVMLREGGVNTVMTRTEDILLYDRNTDYQGQKKVLDLAARRQITEGIENAVFVSIHMNAFPEEKYCGLQVFYSPNDARSQALAALIQDTVHQKLQPQNERKIKQATSSIYLLDRLQCPAVLIECGFLSNPQEAALLADDAYRKELTSAIFCAVISYISSQNA